MVVAPSGDSGFGWQTLSTFNLVSSVTSVQARREFGIGYDDRNNLNRPMKWLLYVRETNKSRIPAEYPHFQHRALRQRQTSEGRCHCQ